MSLRTAPPSHSMNPQSPLRIQPPQAALFPTPNLRVRPPRKAALASRHKLSTLYAPTLLDIDSDPDLSPTSEEPSTKQVRMNYPDSASDSDEFIDDLEPRLSSSKKRKIAMKRKRKRDENLEKLDMEDLELVGLPARSKRRRNKKGAEGDYVRKRSGDARGLVQTGVGDLESQSRARTDELSDDGEGNVSGLEFLETRAKCRKASVAAL